MGLTTISGGGAFTNTNISNINSNFAYLGSLVLANPFGVNWFVDGDNGSDTYNGLSPTHTVNTNVGPRATIGSAISSANSNDRIYITPRKMSAGATDPSNYAEALTITAGKSGLWLIGLSGGPAQGNQPQIKKGSGTAPLLTIQSPGCVISGLSFNGGSSTGGGIKLDDDASTKSAFGTVITNCFFKNCVVTAHDSRAGGAIWWASTGGAWQVNISNNQFYDNVGGISLTGTSNDRPKDIIVTNNIFGGSIDTTIDSYIYGAGGSGFNDISITYNTFTTIKPTISAGSIALYMDLTGVASGIVAWNSFGGASGTYGASGNAAKIPTTMGIAGNYQDGALIART